MNPAKKRLCAGARSALPTTAALALLWAAVASSGAEVPLKFNTYYTCNGQRIVIRSCVNQSNSDFNDCIVQFPDRPRAANGQVPTAFPLRRNLVTTLQSCQMGATAPDPYNQSANDNNGAPSASGPSFLGSLYRGTMGLFASGWSLFFTLLIGWWVYKRIRNLGFLARRRRRRIIHQNNQAALLPFGEGNPYAREKAILEAFDSNSHTFQFEGVNRASKPKVRFVLQRSIKTFKRRDLEALRFAYVAYNRGLLSDEAFHAYRITAIYGDGETDPAETQFLGMFSFLHRQDPRHAISAARNNVAMFAQANCQQGLYQHALALVQALVQKFPKDELFADMLRRFLEGTRWLGIGDVQRSAFALPDPPSPFQLQFGTLDGTSKVLSYSGNGSILTIAPPGSGKTTCNVVPNLLRWPGAAVVLDVKGEIYDLTSKWRSTIGPIIRFSPLDPQHSQCYNPLAFVRRESLYVWEDAMNAANMMLIPGQGGDKNKMWEDLARDLLTAIIADLAFWERPEDRPMSKVLSILNRNGWDEFVERLRLNPEIGAMRDMGVSLAKENPETLASILTVARSSMNSWKGERIGMITRKSDWHPLDLRRGAHPTIYICINSEDIDTYASLLRVFIAQHLNALLSQKVPPQGAEPILFCLDEFPRLGGMRPIEKALEVGRGFGIRLWLFAQNFGQIEAAYENADGLMENCLVRTFMNPTVASAGKIAEEIGKAGIAQGADSDSTVSPQELAGPNFKNLQIVVGQSSKPAKVRKQPYYENAELKARIGSLDDAHTGANAPAGRPM
ncbi:MAG TPA: type IV secretory system conjugative DNA transfer family protein [Steroidobacteraceae bacterium]|nr:type IV secretory system conjugative DNA transfer family protein [Steroidobacteraceae bacterium]